ncbi:proto-oncogene serine/threonine-protein kinase mos [Lampris incognitus]|uniref:proto-oncogene serine/threonine-protein kinase mos n=1 Tax=Lampris incognitus TaxID=2546036 RepID=UPI0024B59F17|nr:proto-oncogene serine/threonine-protein kinase mos [Lampris incognitus]
MPSPIPATRLLPKDLYPSPDTGTCSSPLAKYSGDATLKVPVHNFPRRAAGRLWSSVVQWKELRSMQPIGSGGFGSVYKARYLGETVAVKTVKKCAKNKLASRQSFWAELHAADLRHANVVRVIAASACVPSTLEHENSIGTVVMEYAGSRNLHSVIYGSTEAIAADRWLAYATDIVRGLGFLHSHGVVHLDLKPANVLVSKDGVCKIADFGCSLKLDKACEGGGAAAAAAAGRPPSPAGGTYTHRAPELLKGERVTAKADIFSFGITLWQLLVREQPYTGDRHHILYAVVAHNLRPPVQGKPAFQTGRGRACETLVCRCWSGDAPSRPSAPALLGHLDEMRTHS